MRFNKTKGQTGIETIMVTGVIISLLVVLGTFYFSSVSDQTTAIIILKTELLKQLGNLNKNYVISSSLEPFVLADGTLCFEVRTSPGLNNEDKIALTAISAGISQKISERTRYKTVEIKVEDVCA